MWVQLGQVQPPAVGIPARILSLASSLLAFLGVFAGLLRGLVVRAPHVGGGGGGGGAGTPGSSACTCK